MVALDADSDGTTDLVLGSSGVKSGSATVGAIYVFNGPCSGSLSISDADAEIASSDTDNRQLGFHMTSPGDVNGDGDDDLLIVATNGIVGSSSTSTSGWLGLLYGPITSDVDVTKDLEWQLYDTSSSGFRGRHVVTGDLDGDGHTDAVWAHGTNAYLAKGPLSGISSGAITSETTYNPTQWVQTVAAGDLDGDGQDDFISADYLSGNSTLAVQFGPVSTFSIDENITTANSTLVSEHPVVADLDGDGTGDLVAGEYYSNAVYLFSGPVTSGTSANVASATLSCNSDEGCGRSIITGDADGDGQMDLFVGYGLLTVGSNTKEGATYLFYGPLSGSFTATDADTSIDGNGTDDRLGTWIDSDGDLDGDGEDELWVSHDTYNGVLLFDGGDI
jgi:hypothetical protein